LASVSGIETPVPSATTTLGLASDERFIFVADNKKESNMIRSDSVNIFFLAWQ
jgi:20S proteasome alpha/beta subunit